MLALRTIEGWLRSIGALIVWDYGPAQLAIHVDMFRNGAPLYRDFRVPPYVPLVYGPVVPWITAKIAPIFGSGPIAALEAGRLIAIASTLVAATMILALARKSGARWAAAALAMLAFILSPIVLRWGFAYRVDMPVLACELGGIFAFANGAAAIALVLFVVSFFIKQGHAVGIGTVVLFCWISGHRRRAIVLAMIWLAAVGLGTAILAATYPYYLLNEFGAVRTLRLDFTAPMFFLAILIGGNLGLAVFAIIAIARRRMSDRLMLSMLPVATVHDFASCLRWGSNAYYFLPALAALAIVSGAGIDLALERIRAVRVPAQFAAGIALALLLSLGFMLAPHSVAMNIATANPWDERALAILRSIDEPILTDTAELKLVDAQPNLQWIDLMVLTSMQELGTFDDGPLVRAVEQHRVGAFALDAESLSRSFRGRPLFWPRLRNAIETNYEEVPTVGPPYLMIPKPQ